LWKERLVLKLKELSTERPEIAAEKTDVESLVLNGLVDLEREVKALKKRLRASADGGKINEEDLDQLKYIQEELRSIGE
jgi:hypothetical protein